MAPTFENPGDLEKALEELESISLILEKETLSLEEALAQYEKGLELLQRSRHYLKNAQDRIQQMTARYQD